MRKLIQGIQGLRHLGVEGLVDPLPKIAVVGDQSTGKSSLIEGIRYRIHHNSMIDLYVAKGSNSVVSKSQGIQAAVPEYVKIFSFGLQY